MAKLLSSIAVLLNFLVLTNSYSYICRSCGVNSVKIFPHNGQWNSGQSNRLATRSLRGDQVLQSTLKASKPSSIDWIKSIDLPNKLTLCRIASIPLFMRLYFLKKTIPCVVCFAASCLTDWLDGFLARKWKLTSSLGAFLDPVADKGMVATSLILLMSQYNSIPFTLSVAAILLREIFVSALREWMAQNQVRDVVQVAYLGKIKTVLQMVAISILLLTVPSNEVKSKIFGFSKLQVKQFGLYTLYASAFMAMISGLQYFIAAWPYLIGRNVNKN